MENEEDDAIRDRRHAAALPKIRDVYGHGASMTDAKADFAARRFEYALEQRDKMQDRLRFGAITLNAASLLTIGTTLGNKEAVTQLGIAQTSLTWPAVFFAFGLASGAMAAWVNGNHLIVRAGEAAVENERALRRKALFDAKISEQAETQLSASLDQALAEASRPSSDFTYSTRAMQLSSLSGSLWLTGLLWIVLKVLHCKS